MILTSLEVFNKIRLHSVSTQSLYSGEPLSMHERERPRMRHCIGVPVCVRVTLEFPYVSFLFETN